MEFITNWFQGLNLVEILKESGIWLVLFLYFTTLIHSTASFISALVYKPSKESLLNTITVFSLLWALFIVVKFF